MRGIGDPSIALRAARGANVRQVMPYPRNLRHVVDRLEQDKSKYQRSENKDLLIFQLMTMIWRKLLHGSWKNSSSHDEVNKSLEKSVQTETPQHQSLTFLQDRPNHNGEANFQKADWHVESFKSLLWDKSPHYLFITAKGIIESGSPVRNLEP